MRYWERWAMVALVVLTVLTVWWYASTSPALLP